MSLEENFRRVEPYVPGEQPAETNVVKLNTNENPYPPSPLVQKALTGLSLQELRRYPDPEAGRLREALAESYGVEKERIFVGVGSDDVLSMAFLTFFHGKAPVLFPEITYSFYDVWASLYEIPFKKIPLTESFKLDAEAFMQTNGGVVFPNPNAPTGVLESLDTVEKIAAGNPDVVVIVDEAYIDFGGESALPLLDRYENLLIVQTFSKSRALAGMRIGFAFGSKELIRALNDVKFSVNSYTMSRAAIEVGVASLADEAYFKESVEKIVATRERVKKELSALGFVFPDSAANFLFARYTGAADALRSVPAEGTSARRLYEALKRDGVYVRYFASPKLADRLRISIGTDREMDVLLERLRAHLP